MNIDENKHLLCYVSISVFCTYGVQAIKHHICRKVGIANNFSPPTTRTKTRKKLTGEVIYFRNKLGFVKSESRDSKASWG